MEVVPRLRLPAVPARVAAALVGAVGGIEEHDVYGAGTEGGEEEVMWHDPLTIREGGGPLLSCSLFHQGDSGGAGRGAA